MAERSEVLKVVYAAIDEVNESLPADEQVPKDEGTILVDKSGGLDSLVLINLVGEIEDRVEDDFDASITIANEDAMSQENSPFKTVGSLVDYVCKLIEEDDND